MIITPPPPPLPPHDDDDDDDGLLSVPDCMFVEVREINKKGKVVTVKVIIRTK